MRYKIHPHIHDRLLLKIHLCVPESTLKLPDVDQMIEEAATAVGVIHHENIEAYDLVWRGLYAPLKRQGGLSSLKRSARHLNQ
ncbi:hypothetical protein [Erythrobacter sp. THAF29]|uniref:hypothetical protein n=1 Tax=Erythrobacter sp. THAF29 TaxID=2587851 RepID=UPI001268AA14|nr:hypothetical protein [Erythrobacter sp. THAF29]